MSFNPFFVVQVVEQFLQKSFLCSAPMNLCRFLTRQKTFIKQDFHNSLPRNVYVFGLQAKEIRGNNTFSHNSKKLIDKLTLFSKLGTSLFFNRLAKSKSCIFMKNGLQYYSYLLVRATFVF